MSIQMALTERIPVVDRGMDATEAAYIEEESILIPSAMRMR